MLPDHGPQEQRRGLLYSDGPMIFLLGKALQVAGMLTLGVALVVYGLGEENMNAELAWLLIGSIVFVIGYGLTRRGAGRP